MRVYGPALLDPACENRVRLLTPHLGGEVRGQAPVSCKTKISRSIIDETDTAVVHSGHAKDRVHASIKSILESGRRAQINSQVQLGDQQFLCFFAVGNVTADALELHRTALLIEKRALGPRSPPSFSAARDESLLVNVDRIVDVRRGQTRAHGFPLLFANHRHQTLPDQLLTSLAEIAAVGFVDKRQFAVGGMPADQIGLIFDDSW